ncbi:Mss4-like protein [Plectosphaerella plurivora]|uniref:Mss4-like protein n=1 Tax=Plectosphaerella plurivora TaxID=936078 RepID=A0A9P8VK56_9PEZI|nr:Mss4-like protein [Plectosphaerella plurivora]
MAALIARCYCGDTTVTLPNTPKTASRCNCSFCARAGAVWAYFPAGTLRIEAKSGRNAASTDGTRSHYFCGRCGMHTHGDIPNYGNSTEEQGGRVEKVNLNMVDHLDWTTVTVEDVDGKNLW